MESKYLPQEFKVSCIRECVGTDLLVSPEQAVKCWRDNIPQAPCFEPLTEAFVTRVLTARKHMLGQSEVCFV